MSEMVEFFASCPKGLEGLLAEELVSFGASNCRETVAGVAFYGVLAVGYRACLWSRLMNRLLMPLVVASVGDAQDLYDCAYAVPWCEHFAADASLKVTFVGSNQAIRHTGFGAQKIKDAVVDYFQHRSGVRPSVDLQNPDIKYMRLWPRIE
jgi:23S rRNA (guanine2445-N2)-methyltransferase / 23S rRNA (guanine2069-N7)-methyltransferase